MDLFSAILKVVQKATTEYLLDNFSHFVSAAIKRVVEIPQSIRIKKFERYEDNFLTKKSPDKMNYGPKQLFFGARFNADFGSKWVECRMTPTDIG